MSEEAAPNVGEVRRSGRHDSVARFLVNRTVKQSDNEYHPTYKKNYVADLPDLITEKPSESSDDDEAPESLTMPKPESRVSDRQFQRLKQETSHLPVDTALKVLAYYHFNVDIAIAAAKQMTMPRTMGDGVKSIFRAGIAFEREQNPTKRMAIKEFYMGSQFGAQCNNKALVDFYYSEKNKIGGNWRLENDEEPMTSKQRIELQEKMISGGVRVQRRDPNAPRKGRNKRATAAIRSHQLRRDHRAGAMANTDDVDSSDTVSVASTERAMSEKPEAPPPLVLKLNASQISGIMAESSKAPEASTSSEQQLTVATSPTAVKSATSPAEPSSESSICTTSSTSTTPQKIPKFKFNLNVDDVNRVISAATSSNHQNSQKPATTVPHRIKKKYRKKTIEEMRGGAQKTYPGRERRPRKMLEDEGY
ncbi:hypothetical protein B9Z55_017386 [Caenorhabditis nigoni]|uniref:Uncharacterized protein n=1 Tax=Caenorhabditis nigoni TaxID=1611254 RepID=A0A2G5T9F9_9PELO|nr:hypothetical protein B9Z55_017386 [Caenorhabditis nigoni]